MELGDLVIGESYVLGMLGMLGKPEQIGVFKGVASNGAVIFYPEAGDTSHGTGPWYRLYWQVLRPVKEPVMTICECDIIKVWNGYGHSSDCGFKKEMA